MWALLSDLVFAAFLVLLASIAGVYLYFRFTKLSPGPNLYHWAGLVLGHRGCRLATLNIPENSLLSFDYAFRNGADGVECDCYLTADDEIVIMHDETIDRMLEGRGNVDELTLEEIQAIPYQRIPNSADYPVPGDLESSFPWLPGHKKDFRCAPTLEQLIVYCKSRSRPFKLMIETKEWKKPGILHKKLNALYEKYDLYSWTYVACFNPVQLHSLRSINPKIPVCYLYCRNALSHYYETKQKEMNLPSLINIYPMRKLLENSMVYFGPNWIAEWMGASLVGVQECLVNGALIEELLQRNIMLDVWTVNNVGSKDFLLENGALVTTDRLFTKEHDNIRRNERSKEIAAIIAEKKKYNPKVAAL